ncbi:hypothetical protein MPL1032_220055 [Mesorhizobium plurifarium]|uniref:Uncharacterized protein n=1 Tax=Mesorhizobium plurifarium TaxID=69974 RepID=A0A0K2VZI5_MESPL|nr:hypothetical protein MPL1032_220055 [Mesorhizobium plurifarium]
MLKTIGQILGQLCANRVAYAASFMRLTRRQISAIYIYEQPTPVGLVSQAMTRALGDAAKHGQKVTGPIASLLA